MTDLNLVFGASGYIGKNLVPCLVSAGKKVRATSRNPEVLTAQAWSGVELVRADALQPETLDGVLRDVDTAYYLVHSMAAGRSFPTLDAQAAKNFANAAARNGVRRIVYLGGLVPDAPRSAHLQSRQHTGDILRDGGVPVTEIRAGMIIGPGSAAWEVIRDLVNHLPFMITPRWVYSRSTPIALDNLLRYLRDAPAIDETAGETYDAGGPDDLTYEEIMRAYGELVGRRPRILPVPVLTPRLSSYWLRLVTSVPTNIARALIDGLTQDVIANDDRLERLMPQDLLGFRDAATIALEADRAHAAPARWVEGSIACRDFHPDYGFYAMQEGAETSTSATRESLWAEISSFGRDGDYFSGRALWWLRRAFDWLIGGPSFRRSRRHPDQLITGDVVDAWRVIAAQPQQSLTLLLEMKAPGAGVLEFAVEENAGQRSVSARAYWHPAGAWGILYWYALTPFHAWLFRSTVRTIVKRAKRRDARVLPAGD